MPKEILLPLKHFALVKAKRGRWSAAPTWASQIVNMSLSSKEVDTAVLGAELAINYGCEFQHPSMWDTTYDPETGRLKKMTKNAAFYLDCTYSLDDRANLHSDKYHAFVSGDVAKCYLHGIEVPDDLVFKPIEEISAKTILAIPNIDVRREMIRKKGIEQLLDGLYHRVLDTQGDYTLYSVMLGSQINSACNFLKMLNPSIGVWHMEGVPNNIQTVRDALLWRNNGWFEHAEDIT